ncbi:MAG: hypothetical protein M3N91_12815 [Pseudomonadota bacterium]|nr:hypothetical protein [Pseudomonadota bacterium]
MNLARTLKPRTVFEGVAAIILAAGLFCGSWSQADTPPVPSKHQMMKDCLAKQKNSEAGRSKEDMKNTCKDVTKTEKQNADKASTDAQPKESASQPKESNRG